ncbi:MAG: tetratricopeptide repeat protein [Spirochaetales bacterium]|nr:tetratricopeptide repeat protein [Spirochaetales bacterium]
MAHTQEKTRLQKFSENLAKFLAANWKKVIIFIVAGIIIIVGLGIVSQINNRKINKSSVALEALEKMYEEEWTSAEEDADKSEIKNKITTDAESIITDYEGLYAAQKALLILGNIAYEEENWSKAAGYFTSIADNSIDSFMAPIALMYAASSMEEAGDLEASRDLFNRVINEYPGAPQEVMRARFNYGRLEEALGNSEAAVDMYNSLIDIDAQDPWSMLAQSRIIFLSK